MEKNKLVYRDGEFLKVLKGKLLGEDDFFLEFECDASIYKINKKDVVSIKTDKGGKEDGKNNDC